MPYYKPYVKDNDSLQWGPTYTRVCTILLDAHETGLIKLSEGWRDFVFDLLQEKTITNGQRKLLGKISWNTIEGKKYSRNSWWKGDLLPSWEKKIAAHIQRMSECTITVDPTSDVETIATEPKLTNKILLDEYIKCQEQRPIRRSHALNKMIVDVVGQVAARPEFIRYTFLSAMQAYAVDVLAKGIMNFDPKKNENIWGYAVQITKNSFMQFLNKRKVESLEKAAHHADELGERCNEANDILNAIRAKKAARKTPTPTNVVNVTPKPNTSDIEADEILAAIKRRMAPPMVPATELSEGTLNQLKKLKASFESGEYEEWCADKDATDSFDRAMGAIEK